MTFHVPETCRKRLPPTERLYSTSADGNNGAFDLGMGMLAIASDGGGWEHVSVSFSNRTPTWKEMAQVKSIFWDAEDCVVQYHPPKSRYVNFHPHCLHLWRPTAIEMPQPPMEFVGPTR
jgi:hypothetical protein